MRDQQIRGSGAPDGSSAGCGMANVSHSLRRLRHELEKGDVKSLAMPRLATGVGGMAWSVVHPLIVQHLGDLKVPICVYTTYVNGQQADESGE